MKTVVLPEQLEASQTITANWADLGSEIKTEYYNTLGAYIKLDVNSSSDVRIRALAKHITDGTDEYVLPIKVTASTEVKVKDHYYEFDADTDQNMLLTFDIDGVVPVVQLQVQAGTVGATAGLITSLVIVKGEK